MVNKFNLPNVVLDCEIYPNHSLFAFHDIYKNVFTFFKITGRDNRLGLLNIERLTAILEKNITFGFNSINYDIPIITRALEGATAYELHCISKQIIIDKVKYWDICKNRYFNHVDIVQPCPTVGVGLKLLGARLNTKTIQDLPYDPMVDLDNDQIQLIREYCKNDLKLTTELYMHLKPRILLRCQMSLKYKIDLRSKSDAQIAEKIMKNAFSITKPPERDNSNLRYEVPEFIKFKDPKLSYLVVDIANIIFTLDDSGKVKIPPILYKFRVKIGDNNYSLGLGGLHSNESREAVTPTKDQYLIDQDVTSYYPSIILKLGLFPEALGEKFLKTYSDIVEARVTAKQNHDKLSADSLKIVINGAFGKFGSKYSILYSPKLLLTTTLTGQLCLLMLIEALEAAKIRVISANTDGVVALVDSCNLQKYKDICAKWEVDTGFKLENKDYETFYARDVNNYLAILKSGVKTKGVFSENSITKNPQGAICALAVRNLLIHSTPIEETVRNCTDIGLFIHARKVTGGAYIDANSEILGERILLGKTVRWVFVKGGYTIKYCINSNKVANSDNCMVLPILPTELPENIDYDHYITDSYFLLEDIGARKSDRGQMLLFG